MTVQIPERLAARIGASGAWVSTIIEIGMAGFHTSAIANASGDLVDFLSRNPTPQAVLSFFLAEEFQERLDFLLDLNGEGEIDEMEKIELGEWVKLDHIAVLLKAQAAKLIKDRN